MYRIGVLLALALGPGGAALADPVPVEVSWPRGDGVCVTRPSTSRVSLERAQRPPLEIGPEEERDLSFLRWPDVAVDSVSSEIAITVRDETVGLTIRADSESRDHRLFVELFGPKGELLACLDCPDAPAVGDSRLGRGTTQMPSTDRPGWELTPGDYRFRVRAIPIEDGAARAEIRADVTATLRADVAVHVEHLVDLNFVYLPGSALDEELATTTPEFAAFLERIDVWMAPTGVRIGRVTHRELDRPEFSIVNGWSDTARMFLTSAEVGRPRALNVYCVEGFFWDPPLPVIGLAGGIPGPALNGTRDSGIALRTSPFFACNDCTDSFAELFAHEIGHYLGFYHTTEANLEREDPLNDTPRCPPENGDLGSCPDRFHVMFPLISPANTIWSPSQQIIAKTHPLVRTVAVLGGEREPSVPEIAESTRIASVGPNPFHDSIRIELSRFGSAPGEISAAIYDLRGRRVRELALDGRELLWDGRDATGANASAGTYFVRLRAPEWSENVRVVKVR